MHESKAVTSYSVRITKNTLSRLGHCLKLFFLHHTLPMISALKACTRFSFCSLSDGTTLHGIFFVIFISPFPYVVIVKIGCD